MRSGGLSIEKKPPVTAFKKVNMHSENALKDRDIRWARQSTR
jgi:hypothetical protein